MILVRHLDLKFLNELAAIMIGTANPPHYRKAGKRGMGQNSPVSLTVPVPVAISLRVARGFQAVSYTHLTLPTNREV